MRHLHLTFIALVGFAFNSFAQQKVNEKAVIKTPTVQCEMCKDKIEKYLIHQYGITAVKVDVKKKTTTVNWITDRTNIEVIKAAIANAGYDADDITADETAYKRLPKCCKKPVETPVSDSTYIKKG
ncbi:MAG: heavy-metal-associated domain-containing protein [Ferruginibacter sp.]